MNGVYIDFSLVVNHRREILAYRTDALMGINRFRLDDVLLN